VTRARLGLAILLALAACQVFGLDPSARETTGPARRAERPSVPVAELALLALAGGVAAFSHVGFRRREMRERRRTALAEAQLDALRFQLRPHFLFNTLHTLLPLVEKDPDRARSMVVRLGDLLRFSLRAEERPLVPLEEEVRILESYLSIEQVRFRDRLQVSIGVSPEAAAAEVPSFLLQPLVEDAIEHGSPGCEGRGRISITARVEGSELAIAVGHDVPGPRSQAGDAGRSGLRHTRRRLEAVYPGRYRLDVLSVPGGGPEIRMRLPLDVARPAALAV
jgi:LytS/YehU family sensor histidine kinase